MADHQSEPEPEGPAAAKSPRGFAGGAVGGPPSGVENNAAASAPVRSAAAIVGLQALAFVVLALIIVLKTTIGHPHSVAGALLGAAMALLGAGVLTLGALGVLRMSPSARTPVVVLELIALPVSYDLVFQAHRVGYGAPILISALAVLYLLFTPAARAGLDRRR